jgi:hypothetical protein
MESVHGCSTHDHFGGGLAPPLGTTRGKVKRSAGGLNAGVHSHAALKGHCGSERSLSHLAADHLPPLTTIAGPLKHHVALSGPAANGAYKSYQSRP